MAKNSERIKFLKCIIKTKKEYIMNHNFLFHNKKNSYFHTSNPKFRLSILEKGLMGKIGESYSLHYFNKEASMFGPVIFASTDSEKIYDSTYDDDIWEILNHKKYTWYEDPDMKFPYVYTKENICIKDLVLIYKGTGISSF